MAKKAAARSTAQSGIGVRHRSGVAEQRASLESSVLTAEHAPGDAGRWGWTERLISQLIAMRKQGLGNTEILTRLFASGLPKRPRHTLPEKRVRAIHALYLAGGSIDELASQIGFTGSAVRQHMQRLELPLKHRGDDSGGASRARRP